jgi:alkaline phosphatase D
MGSRKSRFGCSREDLRLIKWPGQETWFQNRLSASAKRGSRWRIIGNQIVFSHLNTTAAYGDPSEPWNNDAWDVGDPTALPITDDELY